MNKQIGKLLVIGIAGFLFIFLLAILGGIGYHQQNQDKQCGDTDTNVPAGPTSQKAIDIAKYEFKFFKSKGLDDVHAAAIVGYSDYESGGLVPSVMQQGVAASQTGWGLFQVTPIDRLKNFAKNKNLDWKGSAVQVEYCWVDAFNHAVTSDGHVSSGGPDWIDLYGHGVKSPDAWKKIKNVSDAAGIFTDCFGRGASSHNNYNDGHEVAARKWYAKLAGKGTGANNDGNVSIGSDSKTDADASDVCGDNATSSDEYNVTGKKTKWFSDMESYLFKWKGKSPYNFGGNPSNLDSSSGAKLGTDCSGYVGWAMRKVGIQISGRPTTWTLRDNDSYAISKKDAKAGDIVMINNADHVGIYLGNDTMIDDQNSGIKVEKVPAPWWHVDSYRRIKASHLPSKYR
ncbi:phage tail tip lysozyme [Lactiplantibacillus plantarum]|uniref:phage tail tip lysozyme n=1 Tax=Lactiplantibacillus plantarum TaxID=1590 RepID=UPI001BADE8BD|nr:phage tail tip lysozyme [Lactiplantibacillus plantarum]MBS0956388.1 C40 family peptidase [Lactiplantibacillus plantarum]